MIAFTRYTANLPNGNPWLGIGPAYSGHGEWRRTSGVAVSFGRHGYAAYWYDRAWLSGKDGGLDAATSGLAAVGCLLGRIG